MTYMLDTNICIYAIKHDPVGICQKIIEHHDKGICISAITYAELEHGVYHSASIDKNAKNLAEFMRDIKVLPFEQSCAEEYGKICAYLQKAGKTIGLMDMLIAAHAKSQGYTVVTNNVREFERVPGLKIENWVE